MRDGETQSHPSSEGFTCSRTGTGGAENIHPSLREKSDQSAVQKIYSENAKIFRMQKTWIRPLTLMFCMTLVCGLAEIGFNLAETHAANGHDRRRDQFPETVSRRY